MAPKVRRPAAKAGAKAAPKAAAKGAAKAAPKAKARVRGGRLGRGGGQVRIRRPAARVRGGVDLPKLSQLSLEDVNKLDLIHLKGAEYYHRKVDVCGNVTGLRREGGTSFLELAATGTKDEELLRALSGHPKRKLTVHICPADCGGELSEALLIHGREFERLITPGEDWMTNLKKVREVSETEDENRRLREAAEKAREDDGRESPPKKKKKKEKKKRKESDDEKIDDKKKKRPAEKEILEVGQQPLEGLFSGTGLDPDLEKRSKVIRRARKLGSGKKKKKKKGSEASDSQKETSTSSSTSSGDEEGGLFKNERKMKQIWSKYPGAISAVSIGEAKNQLLTASGTTWMMEKQTLPPLMTQYSRQVVMPGLSAPMSQEVLSVSQAIDLLLMGCAAACCDLLCQRLKSLESLGRGNHWSIGRQLELVKTEPTGLMEEQEARAAARLAREEQKLRDMVARPYYPRGNDAQGSGGKGKKGKDKNGKSRSDENPKGKGADGKREDQKGGWQKKQ